MKVVKDKCIGCGTCMAVCPENAIFFEDGRAKIDPEKCVKCGTCKDVCPVNAIEEN